MNSMGDGPQSTPRRYRIKLRTPRPQPSPAEVLGWLIGRGRDTLRLWHGEIWLPEDVDLVQHTDVWIFLTAGGEIVTAVALNGRTGSSGSEPSGVSDIITADWLFQGFSLPAAVEWGLHSLERHPHLSVRAVLAAVKEAREWLDTAPVFPSSSQRVAPEIDDSHNATAWAHSAAEHKGAP